MKRLLMISIAILWCAISAMAQVNVDAYYKKDGTYVQPHVRTSPDGIPQNNYSYPGNYNPYTGKTAGGSEQTYLNRYNSSPTVSNYSTSTPYVAPYVPAESERTYWVDKRGRTSGYTTILDKGEMSVRYKLYNIGNTHVGYMTEYYDGEKWIYDMNGELVKRIRAKKK